MKCPYCGGEVSSQSVNCPYCGNINPEGVAFQEEVQKKIERNRLLKPFLIKQKTPELIQKMLTRIAFILIGVNVLLFVFSIGLYVWGDRKETRIPQKGSYAEQYYSVFMEADDYYFSSFVGKEMNEMIDMLENGEKPDHDDISYLVSDACKLLADAQKGPEAYRQEVMLTLQAFFRGYLGLSEEEAAFLEPEEDGTYDRFPDTEKVEAIVSGIENRLQEVLP